MKVPSTATATGTSAAESRTRLIRNDPQEVWDTHFPQNAFGRRGNSPHPCPVYLPGTEPGHPPISRFNVFAGYAHIADIDQVSEHWLERIGHFFEHYKDLEKGKWVKLDGRCGAEEAKQIILQSIERYNSTPEGEKPHF